MKLVSPDNIVIPNLEQLLCRGDIWRGQSQQTAPISVLDSGYAMLNERLKEGGWPTASLIEVCQPPASHAEWQLLTSALLNTQRGLVVLLNPPTSPFAQALLKVGIDLERLLIVETKDKADFLASFIELTRSNACDAVMAWQPAQPLRYTELRKCALASAESGGISVLFRPHNVRDQSSPAHLRLHLEWQAEELSVCIFKQKGELGVNKTPISLPLPSAWQGLLPHTQLDQLGKPSPKVTNVTPIRGGGR